MPSAAESITCCGGTSSRREIRRHALGREISRPATCQDRRRARMSGVGMEEGNRFASLVTAGDHSMPSAGSDRAVGMIARDGFAPEVATVDVALVGSKHHFAFVRAEVTYSTSKSPGVSNFAAPPETGTDVRWIQPSRSQGNTRRSPAPQKSGCPPPWREKHCRGRVRRARPRGRDPCRRRPRESTRAGRYACGSKTSRRARRDAQESDRTGRPPTMPARIVVHAGSR